jgi:hypothetical protein
MTEHIKDALSYNHPDFALQLSDTTKYASLQQALASVSDQRAEAFAFHPTFWDCVPSWHKTLQLDGADLLKLYAYTQSEHAPTDEQLTYVERVDSPVPKVCVDALGSRLCAYLAKYRGARLANYASAID